MVYDYMDRGSGFDCSIDVQYMSEKLLKTGRVLLEGASVKKDDIVAVQIHGKLYDLHTKIPAPYDDMEWISVYDPKALPILRHSTAHIMADAVQGLFPGTKIAFGPAIAQGFYYDYDRPEGPFREDELREIEKRMLAIIERDSCFQKEIMTRQQIKVLLEKRGEFYKLEHLKRLVGELSIYRHGDWLDLCEGPHVPSTRFLKAFKLTHTSGAYWRGNEHGPMLQRIYGTAFPSAKQLKVHLHNLEQAKKRDHRVLGRKLELIAFHPLAPASPFFTPRGAKVYHLLVEYVRSLYDRQGYQEVITPQVFDNKLFRTSGHIPTYLDNLFFTCSNEEIHEWSKQTKKEAHVFDHASLADQMRSCLKPMNCPSHCLLFGMKRRSYRELPYRIADFGRLHRYERSGVVQGLTRVRSFVQDDAHIFCTPEQLEMEIIQCLDLVYTVYQDFHFSNIQLVFATRPDKRIGCDDAWDRAEGALIGAMKQKGVSFEIAEGEGAFYGPKVEFHLEDALGRPWQLGTIQVDFNLPARFELTYIGEDNCFHQPVMLHRAILGSIERFFGILLEHLDGAFPIWLAPEQLMLLSVSTEYNDYVREVQSMFVKEGFRASVDLSNERLGAKIRLAKLKKMPLIGVIGQKEKEHRAIALRFRESDKKIEHMSIDKVMDLLMNSRMW